MTKITIVGAGAVGSTAADNILKKQLAEKIVLLDIREGLAEGKAIDMQQTASTLGFETHIEGVTNDYTTTAASQVVVITSGVPRKPGMTREELIGVNANIVGKVSSQILEHSPDAIIVVVSNPMDTMTYLAIQQTQLPRHRVIGMGGILDSSRFKYYLSRQLSVSAADLQALVIGGHGDTTMMPLIGHATWGGVPITSLLSEDEAQRVVSDTMVGGATLTKLIGTSAWYAPGASIAVLVESIMRNQRRIYPCSVLLDGEYGTEDICIGVPVVITNQGCEKVIELPLSDAETTLFEKSVSAVRNMNNVLKTS